MAKYSAILIGAAIGAGTSAVTGGDPLKGALMGGVGGAIGASDFSSLTGKSAAIAGKSGGISLSKGFSGVGPNSASASVVNNATSSASSGLFGMSTGQLVSTAIGGAGVLSSASAQYQQGLNTQAQQNFSANITEEQSQRSRQETEQINRDFLQARSDDFATRTSLLGISGGNTEQGSLLNVSSDYAGEIAYQSAKILNQGQVTSSRLQQQAALTRMSGANARRAGASRAGSTVLLGGAQLASNFFV
jgi:hypothetical protein